MIAYRISEYIESIAPLSLAIPGDEVGFLLGDRNREVQAVDVLLRPTLAALNSASEVGVGMIIIHEALTYSSERVLGEDKSMMTKKPNVDRLRVALEAKMAIYRVHTNWDDAPDGNNETLLRKLNLRPVEAFTCGRVGETESTSLRAFSQHVKTSLGCDSIIVVGDMDCKIRKVAVVSGSGNSFTTNIDRAYDAGADAYVSGDIKDSVARYARELDLALIDAGHYATETPGMKVLASKLQAKFSDVKIRYNDISKPWIFV